MSTKAYKINQKYSTDDFNQHQVYRTLTDAELEQELYRLDGISSIREEFLSYPHRV